MLLKQWISVAVLAVTPLALGQDKPQSSPFDSRAPAGALRYESSFTGYRTAHDEGSTPDQLWRQANHEMGKLGGHAGHVSRVFSEDAEQAELNGPSTQSSPGNHGKHH